MFTRAFATQKTINNIILIAIILTILIQTQPAISQMDEEPTISGGLTWSPDGEIIAVGTSDGIWLHSSNDLLPIEQLTEQQFITTLDWGPDTNRIVSGTREGTLQVLDASTGEIIFDLPEHQQAVSAVQWSPDGRFIASCSWDNTLKIWDAETGQSIYSLEPPFSTAVYSLSWSPDSQYVAVSGQTWLSIWNTSTGEQVLDWESQWAYSIAWSPDGNSIATSNSNGQIILWNPNTGEIIRTLGENELGVYLAVWQPNSNLLLTDGESENEGWELTKPRMMRVWDTTTGEMVAEFEGGILITYFINMVDWSPDGNYLASVSDDGKIYLWDMETYEQIATYEGYRSIIQSN